MDLIMSLRVLRRYWLLTIFLLLVTLAGTAAVVFVLPWSYQAQSTMVLLPSRNASQTNGFNPYLSFDSSVTNTAFLMGVVVTGPASRQALVSQGDTGTYTIGLSPDTDGPVLIATATAPTKSDAENTLKAVTAAVGANLHQLQVDKGVLPKNQIQFQVAAITSHATVLVSKKAKTVVLALALGLFLTVGVPMLVDARAARRRQERQDAEELAPRPAGGSGSAGRPRPDEQDAHRQPRDESELAGARRPRQWTE
jgi:capsular polysaccharide biosynthesis protein